MDTVSLFSRRVKVVDSKIGHWKNSDGQRQNTHEHWTWPGPVLKSVEFHVQKRQKEAATRNSNKVSDLFPKLEKYQRFGFEDWRTVYVSAIILFYINAMAIRFSVNNWDTLMYQRFLWNE